MSARPRVGIVAAFLLLVAVLGGWFVARASRHRALRSALEELHTERLRGGVARLVERLRAEILAAPTDAQHWGNLGYALFANEWPHEAERCFAQAEALDSSEPRWAHAFGAAALPRDPKVGLAALERAWKLQPRDAGVAATLIEALRQAGDAPGASAVLAECDLERSENARLLLAAARFLHENGAAGRAYPLAQRGRTFASTIAETREASTLLLSARPSPSDEVEGKRESRRLQLLPRGVAVHHAWSDPVFAPAARYAVTVTAVANRLQALAFDGKTAEALELLESLPAEERQDARVRASEALVHLRLGDASKAEKIVAAGLAETPDDLAFRFAEGYIRLATNKFAEAEAAFAEVAKLDPASHAAHYTRGLCLLRLRRPKEALAAFDAALAIFPGKPEALEASAKLLEDFGETAKAGARRDDLALVRGLR
jgi:tetratricopeptide (TPR) repeat protein